MGDVALVSIAEVRALANSLFDAIEEKGHTAVKVESQSYWSVYFAEMFAPGEPRLVVGDIMDDLADARLDLAGTNRPSAVWHAAHHVAGLIQLLAHADADGKLI